MLVCCFVVWVTIIIVPSENDFDFRHHHGFFFRRRITINCSEVVGENSANKRIELSSRCTHFALGLALFVHCTQSAFTWPWFLFVTRLYVQQL